jgi:hypothetical protein
MRIRLLNRTHCLEYLIAGTMLLGAVSCETPEEEPEPFSHTYVDNLDPKPAANLDEREYPDTPVVPDPTTIYTGSVKDIFTNAPLADAEVYTKGIAPALTATTDADGSFSLDIPVGSVFWARTYKGGANEYLYSRVDISQPLASYVQDLPSLSQATFDAMETAFGVTQNVDCGAMVIRILNTVSVPQPGVADLTIYGAQANGPYFLAEDYSPDGNLNATSSVGWAVFLNVCDVGEETVTDGTTIQLAAADVYYNTLPVYTNIYGGGISLATMTVQEGAPEPEPEPEPVPVIDFPEDIVPIFAKYACTGCHSAEGAASGTGLFFNEPSENIYAKLLELEGVVNLQYPDQSTLLTKPLVEDPPDHPNGSFADVYNTDYLAILQWIEAGAPYGVEPAPPPVEDVDFLADIYPLFQTYDAVNYPYGRGCTACHGGDTPSGGLDLSTGADNAYLQMIQEQLYDLNYPERSSILRNPYCGPDKCLADEYPETHSTEVFLTTDDPDYQKILLWVTQGAQYEVVVEPGPDLAVNVDFASQVQYRFATRGCTGCHSKESPSGGLSLVGTPQEVYDAAYAQATPTDYVNSSIFAKPNAYYPEVTHGGPKQIPNLEDPYARYVGGWIYEGAVFVAPAPMDFATDIYPQFQVLGCVGCHNDAQAVNYGNLSLQGDAATVFAALNEDYTGTPAPGVCEENDCNRVVAGYPAQSYVLTKAFDLYADVNHGGGKTQASAYYTVYQNMANWISEGATYDGSQTDGGPGPDVDGGN